MPKQQRGIRLLKQFRRSILQPLFSTFVVSLFVFCSSASAQELPVGSHPEPLEFRHFPSRLHAYIWRNWTLVEAERIAKVIGADTESVREIAQSMGLPANGISSSSFRSRGYITLIRRNWHLLPYEQILELTGLSKAQMHFILREEYSLFARLGGHKPRCSRLEYHEPSEREDRRSASIKQFIKDNFKEEFNKKAQPRFQFVKDLAKSELPHGSDDSSANSKGLRCIHSYFGRVDFGHIGEAKVRKGDDEGSRESRLLEDHPEGLLQELAAVGVNGIWLHVVLRDIATGGKDFPEFGKHHVQRQKQLQLLVNRAKKFGIGVYLHINEPRSMPQSFFKNRPELAGVQEDGHIALCTTNKSVRDWLQTSLTNIFTNVSGLAGVFISNSSENLTHCWSKSNPESCPRCKSRTAVDVVAALNTAIEKGIHAANPDAKVIFWDTGWSQRPISEEVIEKLPTNDWLMTVSEWGQEITRGNVTSKVTEYSVAIAGPSPQAIANWKQAKKRGLRTLAKVQFSNSWELSSVPYLPLFENVADHAVSLREEELDGYFLSWTNGGYPSPNLKVSHVLTSDSNMDKEKVLSQIAAEIYGKDNVKLVREAWKKFGHAFEAFPFHEKVVQHAPLQIGAANLLFATSTGYTSAKFCLPYDDLQSWRGPYSEETFEKQFGRVEIRRRHGTNRLERALKTVPPKLQEKAKRDFGVARAAGLHFRSIFNQLQFLRLRNKINKLKFKLPKTERREILALIGLITDSEVRIARDLFTIARDDSRIGFEASNHYFFVPLDLVEKAINAEFVRDQLNARYVQ